MLNYLSMELVQLRQFITLWKSRHDELDRRIKELVAEARELASQSTGAENVNVYLTPEGEVNLKVTPRKAEGESADLTNLVVFSRHGYSDDETLSRMIEKDREEGPYDPSLRKHYKKQVDESYDLYSLDKEEFDYSHPPIDRLELSELEAYVQVEENLCK